MTNVFLNSQTKLLGASLLSAVLLSGCGIISLGADYQRPALEVPAKLSIAQPNGAKQVADVDWLVWWKSFQDPVLDALLQEAADKNQDLALATARIEEARANAGLVESNSYPTVDLSYSASRKRISENSATYNSAIKPYSNDRQLGLSASYDIDFWGKFAKADEAAKARLLSQSAARGTVLSTLYASIAQNYFSLRALDAQTTLAEQTLATRKENLRLQQLRFKAGVIGEIDLRQAESEAASIEATLQQTKQNRSNAEAAIAVLLGRQPSAIARPVIARGADISTLYARQSIPKELPADVLNRRPDLIAAEQNLVAANADVGQARAAYFPKLSLTAGVGRQSKDLADLFDPASAFWNLMGNLTQPIFRAGAIDAAVAASNAKQQQAVAQYTLAVQNAFRDVHDALNNVETGSDIVVTNSKRIEALRATLRLAELRYKNGYSSYLEVLNAQRDLAQAESGFIETQRVQLSALVSLYKALGGGWTPESPTTK